MSLKAKVIWGKEKNNGRGVYAILAGTGSGNIVYIGLSYVNTEREAKLRANHRPYVTAKVEIWDGGARKVLTKKRLEDVERCLIHAAQPIQNKNKKKEGPKKILSIQNLGKKPGKLQGSFIYQVPKQKKPPKKTQVHAKKKTFGKKKIAGKKKSMPRRCKCNECKNCTSPYTTCTRPARGKGKHYCKKCFDAR